MIMREDVVYPAIGSPLRSRYDEEQNNKIRIARAHISKTLSRACRLSTSCQLPMKDSQSWRFCWPISSILHEATISHFDARRLLNVDRSSSKFYVV